MTDQSPKGERSCGFLTLPGERRRELARQGGVAAHEKGRAHEWTPEEAREAGRKSGLQISKNRVHMAAIGRKGGSSRPRAASAAQPAPPNPAIGSSFDDVLRADGTLEEITNQAKSKLRKLRRDKRDKDGKRGRKPRGLTVRPADVAVLKAVAEAAQADLMPWFLVRRARIVLGVSGGKPVKSLALRLNCSKSMVYRTRQCYERKGLGGLLQTPPRQDIAWPSCLEKLSPSS